MNALDNATELRRAHFDCKTGGKHDTGMIAEQVGQIIFEVGGHGENGKDAEPLDYGILVALVIEAVKEQ